MDNPSPTVSVGTVLVATNEPATGEYLKKCLSDIGRAAVRVVSSGEDMVREARQNQPDLIVVDQSLSGPMGAMEAIEATGRERYVPAIIIASEVDEAMVKRIVQAGPQGFIMKPLSRLQARAAVALATGWGPRSDGACPETSVANLEATMLKAHPVMPADAGIRSSPGLLDPGACPGPRSGALRGDNAKQIDTVILGRTPSSGSPGAPAQQSAGTDLDALAIIEGLPHALFVKDDRCGVGHAGRAPEELPGVAPAEIMGKRLEGIVGEQAAKRLEKSNATVFQGMEIEELHEVRAGDRQQARHLGKLPIRGRSEDLMATGIACPLATQSGPHLETAVSDAHRQAVEEMASGLAFTLKNLLQVILGRSQLAAARMEEGSFSGARASLDAVQGCCKEASDIVRSLELLYEPEKKDGPESTDIVDASQVIGDIVEKHRNWFATVRGNGDPIGLILSRGPGCFVRITERELSDIAASLIRNAAEALPRGGEIIVTTFRENGSVFFQVQDNGTRTREADVSDEFQPRWATNRGHVAGIGLAASSAILNRRNGEISVESSEGHGTIVTVRLPLAEGGPEMGPPAEPGCSAIPSYRVLVVDDMEPVLTALEDSLRFHGQQVLTASSGREGTMVFEEYAVDVIVCDLKMPDMDGVAVADYVRQACEESGMPKPPFILLTAWDEKIRELGDLSDAGVDAVISKPVQVSALLERILDLMRSASLC